MPKKKGREVSTMGVLSCVTMAVVIAMITSITAGDLGVPSEKITTLFFAVLMCVFGMFTGVVAIIKSAVIHLRREIWREREQLGRKEGS